MKIFQYIFLYLCIINVNAFYSNDEVVHCDTELDDDRLSKKIRIQPLDVYIFLIGAPIAFMCTLFISITFIKYPETRKLPSDLVFCVSLSDCILCIHWFISALYQIINGHGPQMQSSFCQVNAMFSLMAGTGEFVYNVLFCLYLRISLKNVLKINKKLSIMLHATAWITMITVPTLAYITGSTGLSLFGTCSFRQKSGFSFGGIVLVGAYMLLSSYTIAYFKTSIPDQKKYLIEKQNFLNYYFRYIVASCVIWSTEAICYLLIGLNCLYFHEGFLMVFITICNISKLCTPFVLSILRYHDPSIKRRVMKLFRGFTRVHQTQSASLESTNGQNYIEKLQQNLKLDQIATILYGVRLASTNEFDSVESFQPNKVQIQSRKQSNTNKKRQSSIEVSELDRLNTEYHITALDIEEQLHFRLRTEEINQSVLVSQDMMESQMTVYGSNVFQLLRNRDRGEIDIYRSLDPEANKKQIANFEGPDGGKGGEFIFFTNDNQIIIKTLKDSELQALISRLGSYSYYLLSNQDSMIAPIYGIYTFTRGQLRENVLVMRNALQIDSQYKIRAYDLKGSENDREVLAKSVTKELNKVTLKDIDFAKMEGKIYINGDMQSILRNSLIRDARFFEKMKLMDYSLLILKMDWSAYCKSQEKPLPDDKLRRLKSTSDFGVYYHLAIIDYLQEWNSEKIIEQNAKKVLKRNRALDTSAKPPDEYAQRFIDKVANAII